MFFELLFYVARIEGRSANFYELASRLLELISNFHSNKHIFFSASKRLTF